jgi:hypothetical protein
MEKRSRKTENGRHEKKEKRPMNEKDNENTKGKSN